MEIGEIKQFRNRVVVIIPHPVKESGKIACRGFFIGDVADGKPEEFSDVHEDVGKFIALIGHAPNMTHDEIKAQIGMLFRKV